MQEDTFEPYRKFEDAVREWQRKNFGERYAREEVSLSKLEVDDPTMNKIVQFMKNPKNMLIWLGGVGTSKSHFCACLGEWILKKFNHNRVYKEEDLQKRLRAFIGEGYGDYIAELKYLIDDDIVILDDVGAAIKDPFTYAKDSTFIIKILTEFVDYRYNIMKPTIITSNFNKKQILHFYGERIHSRIFASENIVIESFGQVDKRTLGM